MCQCCCCSVTESCLTLCNPSVHHISLSFLKLMFVEAVMPSNHLILSSPLPMSMSILYVCFYIVALQINYSVPFFLDYVYMCQNTVFIFLFLTHFTPYNRFYVHPPHKRIRIRMNQNQNSHQNQNVTQTCFFLWLSNIPLYICTITSLSVHLSMDIQVASMFYLL